MVEVIVVVEQDEQVWTATSPSVPGWLVVANTLAELEDLAREGLMFFFDLAAPGDLILTLTWPGAYSAAVTELEKGSFAVNVGFDLSSSFSVQVHPQANLSGAGAKLENNRGVPAQGPVMDLPDLVNA